MVSSIRYRPSSPSVTNDLSTSAPSTSRSPPHTASAASSVAPSRNTDSRRASRCSASSSRSQLQSTTACSVWCRGRAVRLPPDSSRNRSPRRAAICSTGRVRRRAVASSMASGSPSRRRHTSPTGAALAAVTANPGRTAAARSAKRRTAAKSSGSAPFPAGGAGSGPTGASTSPVNASGSRLVARIRTPGHAPSTCSARCALAATRCSQLSSRRSSAPAPPNAASSRSSGSCGSRVSSRIRAGRSASSTAAGTSSDSARMSSAQGRSRKGYRLVSAMSSATASAARPHDRVASIRSSVTASRSSSSRTALARANGASATSARAGPRHSATAASNSSTACRGSPAARPAAANRSNSSTSRAHPDSRYPPGTAASAAGSGSARRSRETSACSAFPASRASRSSSVRSRAPPIWTGRPSASYTVSAPSIPIRTLPASHPPGIPGRPDFWQARRVLTLPARLLCDSDRRAVQRLLDRDPYAGAQVAEQIATYGLAWWRTEARVFGYGPGAELESLCWLGNNLIPVHATPAAVAAFAELAGLNGRTCSSLVGTADAVLDLWTRLAQAWGGARDVRPCQPLLATATVPAIPHDPHVRLVREREVDAVYPAAVAMYTEEVGVSPTLDGGDQAYRERVADLVHGRRMYARFVDGQVVFKAELAAVTRHTAQVQGVWVTPRWRGQGLATHAMAAVVRDALHRVAPTVSLYVNDYNHPARAVYTRCGFRRVGTFATVLF